MSEVWKDIKGYEGFYKISNHGRVKSMKRTLPTDPNGKSRIIKERILKQINRSGYRAVQFHVNKKIKAFQVHRLIALYFIDNPNKYPYINHINAIRHDNRIENLEWCTQSQNIQHALSLNLFNPRKGEKHRSAKLTEKDVLFIRDYVSKGGMQKDMSIKYGLHTSSISSIISKRKWGHI